MLCYCLKCLSMECPPARKAYIVSEPKWILRGKTPMALQTENLPPTKSQKPNTFSLLIPNLSVSVKLVEQAQMCLPAILALSVSPFLAYSVNSHCLTLFALSIVSAVVKVFEFTRTKVYSTSKPEHRNGCTFDSSIEVYWVNVGQKSDFSAISQCFVLGMRPQSLIDKLNRKIAASNTDNNQVS